MGDRPSDDETPRPLFGNKVWLTLDCCDGREHEVRAEGSAGNNLLLSAPVHADPEAVDPEPGIQLKIGWGAHEAFFEVPARLVMLNPDAGSALEIEPLGTPKPRQRRQFIRVACVQPAQIMVAGGDALSAMMVNLGEGGVGCTIAAGVPKPEGELRVSFSIGDETLTFDVRLASWEQPRDDRRFIGLAFLGVTDTIVDHLRQHIFNLQIAERRRQRDMA